MSKSSMPNTAVSPHETIQCWVRTAIQNALPGTKEYVFKDFYLNSPPTHIEADYALSIFFLREGPNQDTTAIALSIIEKYSKESIPLVKKIYAIGPYINVEVDKSMYCEMAINHILSQGSMFCSSKKENPQSIHINYLDTDMRTQLVGQVIGKHYKQKGYTVAHCEFIYDDVQLISVGREVVSDALNYKVAEYVSNTNVVMTLPTKQSPSIILQRHNKSLTRDVLHLAFQKKMIQKEKPSTMIYVTPMHMSQTVATLISNMRLLRYIDPEMETSVVFVDASDLHQHVSNNELAAKYAVLRIPIDKKAYLKEDELLIYSRLEDVILNLEQSNQRSKNMDFDLVKLLITFPDIVAKGTDSHWPDTLCAYLEKVAELCDKRSIYGDLKLSQAASTVLRNGLNLLFS